LKGVVELGGLEGVELLVVPNVIALQSVINSRKEDDGSERLEQLLLEVLKSHFSNRVDSELEEGILDNHKKNTVIEGIKNKYKIQFGSYADDIFSTYK
jgi:hypothetical protein